jgi:TolA-binding protein
MHTPSSMFFRGFVFASLSLGGALLAQDTSPRTSRRGRRSGAEGHPGAPAAQSQPVLDDPQSRPAPPRTKGPDDDMFDFATLAYDRQEWAMASQSYAKYLQKYPAGTQVPDASSASANAT